ncbi:MAG: histidinol dehydrogenase, partial [Deltaproteobacteria bacterium]|nr:histidinol dehydrogenase [Candidatus Tharpella sp.]
MMDINCYRTSDADFEERFKGLCERNLDLDMAADGVVAEILERVRKEGDPALFDYTRRFDGLDLVAVGVEVQSAEIDLACDSLSSDQLHDIELAIERITAFHQRQLKQSWFDDHEPGVLLGQKVTPLLRVG